MSKPPGLDRGGVHLWHISTEAAKQNNWLHRYRDLLSDDEHQRHQKFVFEKDRDQFLISRALLRTTLSRYSGERPDAWRFRLNEFGKPEIEPAQNGSKLRFNISHCEGLVVCGLTIGHDLGVDCENINREFNLRQLASEVFSNSEREHLQSLPPFQRTETFFRLWTLKEAYIKARGIGMSLPLRKISFDITAADRIAVFFGDGIQDQSEKWQFVEPVFPDPFSVAIAVRIPCREAFHLELFTP